MLSLEVFMNQGDQYPNRSKTYNKKRKKWRTYILTIIIGIVVIGGGATGYAYWKLNDFLDIVTDDLPKDAVAGPSDDPKDTDKEPSDKANEPNVFSILMVGVDFRPELGSLNTDVMMLATVNSDEKSVSLISIPRDTYIHMDGYHEMKMNAVYAQGEHERIVAERNDKTVTVNGPILLKQAVGELFNVPVEYYVRFDFDGFKKVIDELGGVKVEVDRDMRWVDNADGTNINLNKGEQILSGKEALDFVRFRRSNDGPDSSDYDRNERQQAVVKASTDKLKSFTGIINFFNVLDAAGEHIRTDIDKSVVKDLAITFRKGLKSVDTLETNAYWDSKYLRTRIDREDRDRISEILINERIGDENKDQL